MCLVVTLPGSPNPPHQTVRTIVVVNLSKKSVSICRSAAPQARGRCTRAGAPLIHTCYHYIPLHLNSALVVCSPTGQSCCQMIPTFIGDRFLRYRRISLHLFVAGLHASSLPQSFLQPALLFPHTCYFVPLLLVSAFLQYMLVFVLLPSLHLLHLYLDCNQSSLLKLWHSH